MRRIILGVLLVGIGIFGHPAIAENQVNLVHELRNLNLDDTRECPKNVLQRLTQHAKDHSIESFLTSLKKDLLPVAKERAVRLYSGESGPLEPKFLESYLLMRCVPELGGAITPKVAELYLGFVGEVYRFQAGVRSKKFFENMDHKSIDALTDAEIVVLSDYTAFLHKPLNTRLRTGDTTQVLEITNTLNKALSKLPAYKGQVVRHFGYLTEEIKKKIYETHTPNSIVTEKGFLSTSVVRGKDDLNDVDMIIESISGRDVNAFATILDKDYEREVLFPTNVKFKVLDVKTKGSGGRKVIHMQEISKDIEEF